MLGLGLKLNLKTDNKTWLETLNPVSAFLDTAETKYAKNRNLWIQIIRDSDSTTLDVGYDAASRATALAWSAGTDSYISKRYNQVNGASDITISGASDQELIITAGAWIVNTAKYCLFEPSNSTLSVMDIPLSVNGRMKNMAMAAYIIQKDNKVAVSGYTSDYVFPVKCSAGLMDLGWTNLSNVFWYLSGGGTSTSARPGATLGAGVSYSFGTNMQANNISLEAYGTGVRFIGNLKDFPRVTYYLDIGGCSLLIGNVVDLPRVTYLLSMWNCSLLIGNVVDLPRVTFLLSMGGCSLLIGNIADLPQVTYLLSMWNCSLLIGNVVDLPRVTYLLSMGGCSLLIGNIADLPQVTYSLDIWNCNLLIGVYTPSSNTNTPTMFNIANTGLSASDLDATIIACDNPAIVKNGVTLTKTGLTRTSASDTAKLDLKTNHSWTFDPDT